MGKGNGRKKFCSSPSCTQNNVHIPKWDDPQCADCQNRFHVECTEVDLNFWEQIKQTKDELAWVCKPCSEGSKKLSQQDNATGEKSNFQMPRSSSVLSVRSENSDNTVQSKSENLEVNSETFFSESPSCFEEYSSPNKTTYLI